VLPQSEAMWLQSADKGNLLDFTGKAQQSSRREVLVILVNDFLKPVESEEQGICVARR
jgi:hypothetical protein